MQTSMLYFLNKIKFKIIWLPGNNISILETKAISNMSFILLVIKILLYKYDYLPCKTMFYSVIHTMCWI